MSDLSERAYFAGWYEGIEFELWQALASGPQKLGLTQLTSLDIEHLGDLSKTCGGWIRFDDSLEEVFVPLLEWEALVRNRLSRA
jgi:hypothetical protein